MFSHTELESLCFSKQLNIRKSCQKYEAATTDEVSTDIGQLLVELGGAHAQITQITHYDISIFGGLHFIKQ